MKLSSLIRYGTGLVILLSLTQCQKVSPQAPKAEGFDAPLASTKSYVSGSLSFRLSQLEDKINRELDPVLVGKGSPGGKRGGVFPFRVARSGRVQVQYKDQQVRFSTPLQLWIVKPFSKDKTPPDRPFCSLQVNFQSPLNVTPNWRLASKVKFTNYEWIVKPQIRILGKEISLEGLAQDMLEQYQPSIESAIDSAIYKELRLDQIVQPIWLSMQKPLLIDKQYGLWLLPKPVAVEASPISGDSATIISHLRITFETKTAMKPSQPAYTPLPLPMLQKREQLPSVSNLQLLSSIPYADINRMLDRTIGQQAKKLALGSLTLKKVSVYGGQRSLIVKADVSGLLNGTVYLRGRPTFDTLTNTLMVNDLDFDANTVDVLPGIAGSLVHKGLVKLLKSLLTISLADDIDQLPSKISEAFARGEAGKKTKLTIKDFRFTPRQVAIRPDGVQALIQVESKVGVQIKKL